MFSNNRIVTAWRTEPAIFLVSPGEQEKPLAEGVDVAIASGQRGVYAVWSTPAGIQALPPGQNSAVSLDEKGSFPTVVALPSGRALAAWEAQDGKIAIRQVPN